MARPLVRRRGSSRRRRTWASKDEAAHSRRGRRTARVEPMYREGGHLYVFLVYGMHHCANVVTRGPSGDRGRRCLLRGRPRAPEGAPATAPLGRPASSRCRARDHGRADSAAGISSRMSARSGADPEVPAARVAERLEIAVSAATSASTTREERGRGWPLRLRAESSTSAPASRVHAGRAGGRQ